MADAVTSEIIRETSDSVLFTFTNISDGSGKSDLQVLDASDLTYKIVTVTLDGAPDTNFCIGETLTFSGTNLKYAVVQDYTRGASTVNVYRVSSGTDNTPIAMTNGAVMGTDETISGSVSGTSSAACHGSTAAALVDPTFTVRQVSWSCAGMSIKLEFDGSDSEQMIGVYGGGGRLDYRHMMGGIPMSAAGNASDVLGDVQYTTVRHTSGDTASVWVELAKGDSFNTPNFEGNGNLGYAHNRAAAQTRGYQ
jgi:hypothetical protein